MFLTKREILDLINNNAAKVSKTVIGNTPVAWGEITGALANQVDLSNTLNSKIDKSIGTNKGDLIVFTGAGTLVRFGSGTNDFVLASDSVQTSGLKWLDVKTLFSATVPITYSSGNFALNYNTTNLKLTSNQLNTIQDIATTSSPTFNQLTLTSAGTTTTSAVRGDRAINVTAPLTGGGNLTADRTLGLSYNTTNLRITSNQLNTIQDIATTSSPTFNLPNFTGGLKINSIFLSDASRNLTTGNIDATGNITTTASLSGARLYLSPNTGYFIAGLNNNIKLVSSAIDIESGYSWQWAVFGQPKIAISELSNILFRATDKFTVTPNVVDLFVGDLDKSSWTIPAGESRIINIDLISKGTLPTTGLTYSAGYFYISFYSTSIPETVTGRVKNSDNVWTDITQWTNVSNVSGYRVWRGTCPINNYLTEIEFTIVAQSGINTIVSAIEYWPTRPTNQTEKPFVSKYTNNTLFTNLYFRDSTNNLKASIIASSGNAYFAGNVGIGTTNPSYKLDVSGTGRFTQDLTLSSLLKQQGTSGTNDFAADINQTGNKSIYNNFTSGWTGSGWRVDYGITAINRSHLELDDLTVRGTMRVYELIINQIRATNGSLFVSSSAKAESVTRVSGDPVTYTITFEDPEGHGVCPFLIDDIIIVQRVRLDSTTIVKQIVCQVTNVTGRVVNASVIYENGQITKGDLVVRIGNTSNTNRQGSVYLTSDDSNAPFIDVVDGVNSWSAWGSSNKLKVRLGKLTGITDSFFGTLSGYGLYAKSNAYLRGKIYAEAGGWLAGWSINSNSLTSPLISSNHQVSLLADNSTGVIGAYLDINSGGANPLYLSFGKIKTGSSSYSSNYGLSAKDETGNDYFELSNNVKHIAGWNFDNQKFYKGTSIELNSNTNSIGVNSNKVKMFYTNTSNWGIEGYDASSNLIFQLGSTNKIAGWTLNDQHIYKLTSGTPTSSPVYGLTISATSTAQAIIAYGSNYQRYVKLGYQTSGNWFGIEGTDSNANIIFQLGSTNKIAGWNFDTTKLSNSIVSLEASASMKGLVVDTDKIKIGNFTATGISNSYTNISSQITNGYSSPTIQSGDTAWAIIGNYYINNTPYSPGISVQNNYINTTIQNEISSWDYRLTHRMFNHDTLVLGRRIKVEFNVEFTLGQEGLAYSGGNFQVAIRYYNSGWGTVYRQVIYEQTIPNNLSGTLLIDRYGNEAIEFDLPAEIPNTATVYIEWVFSGGAQTGTYYPYDMDLMDLNFYGYVNYKTWINEKGLQLYNSDTNYIKLTDTDSEINVPILKNRGKPMARVHGRLSSAPTQDIELGDIYINSSNNNIYQCYDINNNGGPQWKQIG